MDIVRARPQRIKNEFYPANERALWSARVLRARVGVPPADECQERSFDPAAAGLVEVWDYLACGELCQFGFAPRAALTRLAVEPVLIPTDVI
jgi:hypothetical protein